MSHFRLDASHFALKRKSTCYSIFVSQVWYVVWPIRIFRRSTHTPFDGFVSWFLASTTPANAHSTPPRCVNAQFSAWVFFWGWEGDVCVSVADFFWYLDFYIGCVGCSHFVIYRSVVSAHECPKWLITFSFIVFSRFLEQDLVVVIHFFSHLIPFSFIVNASPVCLLVCLITSSICCDHHFSCFCSQIAKC
jgi:hypothetical protein